jgi:hypothetical protein
LAIILDGIEPSETALPAKAVNIPLRQQNLCSQIMPLKSPPPAGRHLPFYFRRCRSLRMAATIKSKTD